MFTPWAGPGPQDPKNQKFLKTQFLLNGDLESLEILRNKSCGLWLLAGKFLEVV